MCTCITVYLKHVNYVGAQSLSRVRLFATLWTVALQAPLSMGFPRQEYWSELPLPPLGIFPTQGSNPHVLCFLYLQADSLPLVPPGKPLYIYIYIYIYIEKRDILELRDFPVVQ